MLVLSTQQSPVIAPMSSQLSVQESTQGRKEETRGAAVEGSGANTATGTIKAPVLIYTWGLPGVEV